VHSMARRDAHPRLRRLGADRLEAVPPGLGARRGPVPPPELLETNVPGVFAAAMWAADRSSGWRPRSVKGRW
jgi:hypothetical protein